MTDVAELLKRLRRKERYIPQDVKIIDGGVSFIIDNELRLLNPDGPEAASTIEALSERIAVLGKAIDDIANGRINTDFVMSEPPDWHKAFGDLQSIAKATSLTPDLSQ